MHMTPLDIFLWVVGFLNNSILLVVLIAKHRARRFPIFTSMIALLIFHTITLSCIHRYARPIAYYNAYWVFASIDLVLQLLVLYEAASKVFCPGGTWAPGIRRTFLWMIAASFTMAAALTWLCEPAKTTLIGTITQRGGFAASILVSELFVGMIVLSVTTGLPLRTHVARIVQFLGAPAIVGILIEALQTYFGHFRGPEFFEFLAHIQIGVNTATEIFLIVTLARNAPEPRALPAQLYRQLLHLNHQTGLALAYLRPG